MKQAETSWKQAGEPDNDSQPKLSAWGRPTTPSSHAKLLRQTALATVARRQGAVRNDYLQAHAQPSICALSSTPSSFAIQTST